MLNWIPVDGGLRGGVDENGRLWIGNNVPLCALHVRDNIDGGGLIVEGERKAAEETIALRLNASSQDDHDAGLRRYTKASAGGKSGALELFTGDNGNLLITMGTGKMGVGTTDPQAQLDVRGDMRIGNARIQSGDNDPEGNVVGNVGDIYLRTAGHVGATLYVKEQGNGNIGWKAK